MNETRASSIAFSCLLSSGPASCSAHCCWFLLSWRAARASSAPPCASLDVPVELGWDGGGKQEGQWGLGSPPCCPAEWGWHLVSSCSASRLFPLGLGLYHGWGELHFSLKGSKGFLSCGRANPNTGDVVPEPQPTQLPVPTLPRESPYHPSNPQEPPYRV